MNVCLKKFCSEVVDHLKGLRLPLHQEFELDLIDGVNCLSKAETAPFVASELSQ